VSDRNPYRTDKFEKQTFVFSLAGFDFDRTDESYFKNNYQSQDIARLTESTDSLERIYSRRADELSGTLNSRYYLKKTTHRDAFLTDSLLHTRRLTPYKDKPGRRVSIEDLSREEIKEVDSAYLAEDSLIKAKIAFAKDSIRSTIFSLKDNDLKITINLDSLYNSMSKEDQEKVFAKTKEFAAEAQSLITRNIEDLTSKKRLIAKFRNAWHQKFTLSFACMIFFFIGAPLGAIIKKGGFGLPIVISVLVFLTYYMISTAGMKLARDGVWESWRGMWLSSIVILPLGIFLTYKATVDAQIFNKEAWSAFFKKIAQFFNKNKDKSE
ncbi:MAG: LptF/LptG family permease, partial [Bacteroidales bacterium]|nr:LptF/LptG family permease [Bacteroidales bacterium]